MVLPFGAPLSYGGTNDPGQAMPQAATIAELAAVYARYRSHLHATYAGPRRFGSHPFWARRLAALAL